ncbi:MAG TPA: hypothetical protein VFQ61_04930 [Polyangiaceae bacterium]|nr:hypothetical protein [Polyangiaceae bacterium]
MRHFAKAFARALPAGCYADAGWLELPLGPVGRAVFAVHIDDTGHIEQVERDPDVPAPAIIQRMIERAIVLLRAGTFSLEPGRVSAGIEWMELHVVLSQTAANTDPDANGRHLRAEGHETPTWQRPGRGYFTLNSGLHMEASLRLLRR